MSIKQEIKALEKVVLGLKNDARYWEVRRTYGDFSKEVLRHLRACESAKKLGR